MPDLSALATYRDAMRNVRETHAIAAREFELREIPDGTGGTNLLFTGYASVVERAYEMEDWLGPWSETVDRAAFDRTLREQADVAFLLNHEGMTLARTKSGTLRLAADSVGLLSEARLDPSNMYVQAMRSAVERGDLDEMSFAFRVTRQEWNEDYTDRRILEVNMHQGDVSVVNYGANPHTAGLTSIRAKLRQAGPDGLVALLREIRAYRAGAVFSAANTAVLQQLLTLFSDADDSVDQGQIILADLLGVPNPDDDDQWDNLSNGDGENDTPPMGQGMTALALARARLDLAKIA